MKYTPNLQEKGEIDMDLNFTVSLVEDEKKLLKDIFNCTNNELTMKIEKFAKASTEEYLRMILGQKVFTRGQDIKEYRLYLLIKYLFNGISPDEQTVTTLFQTTNNESELLLKSVLTNYQYELKESINETIKLILQNDVDYDEDKHIYYVSSISSKIIDEMNKILSSIDGSLNEINKRPGALQTFDISISSYNSLYEYCDTY